MRSASETITIRLRPSRKVALQNHCENINLSINQFINLLIEKELYGKEIVIRDDYAEILRRMDELRSLFKDGTGATTPAPSTLDSVRREPIERKKQKNPSSGRFTMIPWQRDGRTVCPICGGWISTANFSRHLKTEHDTTPLTVFTNEEYKKIADRYVAKYDEEKTS